MGVVRGTRARDYEKPLRGLDEIGLKCTSPKPSAYPVNIYTVVYYIQIVTALVAATVASYISIIFCAAYQHSYVPLQWATLCISTIHHRHCRYL
jgi:hypothetical protein